MPHHEANTLIIAAVLHAHSTVLEATNKCTINELIVTGSQISVNKVVNEIINMIILLT